MKIEKAIEELKQFIESKRINVVISTFSGGKDSLISTIVTQRACELVEVEFKVVFIDTTCSLPNTIEYVKEISKRMCWSLDIIRPERTFWELVAEKGAPTPRRRWCCQELKIKPLKRYLEKIRGVKLVTMGLRNNESYKRSNIKKYYWNSELGTWMYNPILDWHERDIEGFIRKENIPVNPNYELIGSAGDCFCVTFTSVKRIKRLAELYPEFFIRMVQIEEKFRNNGSLFFFCNRRVYAKDFISNVRQSTLLHFR